MAESTISPISNWTLACHVMGLSETSGHMISVRLICDRCWSSRIFRGATMDALLAAVAESEWLDRSFTESSKLMWPGRAEGRCPACYVADFTNTKAAQS